jgi:hypothetical protein
MAPAKMNGWDYENMMISATGERTVYWVKNVIVLNINLNDLSTVIQVSGV